MSNPTQAVAKRTATPVDVVRSHIESPQFLEQVKMAMPRGEDGRRLVRGAITAIQKNPAIAECNQTSLFTALLTCAQLGLNLDGREAHLVPFGKEVTLIPDYKGIVRLVLESGKVSYVHASEVCENDDFDFDRGQIVRHKIDLRRDRGPVYAFYALARFKDGGEKAEVMSVDDVNKIRARSRQANAGMWVKDYNEAGKKTVFKRLSKWLPLAPEAVEAIEKDNEDYAVETTVSAPPLPAPSPRSKRLPQPEPEPPQTQDPDPEPPQEPPPPTRGPKPKVVTEAHTKVTEWATANGIEFGEVVTLLIDHGVMPESAKRAGFIDLLPGECEYLLKSPEQLANAILSGRA